MIDIITLTILAVFFFVSGLFLLVYHNKISEILYKRRIGYYTLEEKRDRLIMLGIGCILAGIIMIYNLYYKK